MTDSVFSEIPKNHFGAILADPPWHFQAWYSGGKRTARAGEESKYSRGGKVIYERATTKHYNTMREDDICAIPVSELAADDCVLFLWICWPVLEQSLRVMEAWGFTYKTCAFAWMKGNASQIEFWNEEITPDMLLGYWTRANSEVCLLGTKGKPKRLSADIRQGIIAPRREHSRKPDGIHDRIERLVAGPYLELFARSPRTGWTAWGNETNKFSEAAE